VNPLKIVFDTTALVSAVITETGVAGRCLKAAQEHLVYVSSEIWNEMKARLYDVRMLARQLHLTPEKLEEWLINLRDHSSTQKIERVKKFISFPRDIKDEKILNLAIQEKATHIVTRDNDLLDLMNSKTKYVKLFQENFPDIKIVSPEKMKYELEQIQIQTQQMQRER